MSSAVELASAKYLAFVLERSTVCCLQELQVMRLLPKRVRTGGPTIILAIGLVGV